MNWEAGTASARTRIVAEAVEERNMEQLVTFPTHVKGNILDLLLTTIPERIQGLEDAGRLGKSDHIMLDVKISVGPEEKRDPGEKPDWRKADWEGMKESLRSRSLEQQMRGMGAEQAWSVLKEKINAAVEKFVPKKRRRNQNRPGWLSQDILREVRRKKRLWKKAKTGEGVEEYRAAEKSLRNRIRDAKRRFEKRIAKGGEDSISKRKFYSYVKNKTKTRSGIGPLKSDTSQVVSEEKDMAELLNRFFSSVFTREDSNNISEPKEKVEKAGLSQVKITRAKVKSKIKKLRAGAAAGPDGIGPQLLKALVEQVAGPLAVICQQTGWKLM